MLISACYITKNAQTFLEQSLLGIKDYVDEIIIADDMSTDGTVKIAEKHGAMVISRNYSGLFPPSPVKGISANKAKLNQKNDALHEARGKYCFMLDADEVYFPEDVAFIRAMLEKDITAQIRIPFNHIWKVPAKKIVGHMWNMIPERIFRRKERMNYIGRHDTVCLKDGTKDVEINKSVRYPNLKCLHYSYLEEPEIIRKKIRAYMLRDNPNANESNVEEWVDKHPYFSGVLNQPRYGDKGLYVAGGTEQPQDKEIVLDYPVEGHPKFMYRHPSFYREYLKGANIYMETHWQFHNHLTYPRHQARLKYTASFCKGMTLEVGCANGLSTTIMQGSNQNAIFSGYEVTDWGYKEAVKNHPNMEFYKGLGESMAFEDGSFSTVLLAEIIEHCLYPRALADEAWRVAKNRMIVTTPTQNHPDPDHKRFFPMEGMRKFLEPYGKAQFYGLSIEGQIRKEPPYYFLIAVVDKNVST